MTLFWFTVLSLAAFRITKFFTDDSLLNELRWKLESKCFVMGENDEPVDYLPVFKKDGTVSTFWTTVRGKMGDLVTCPSCLGFWVSLVVYLLWDADILRWGLIVWAIAGLQVVANKIFKG